MGGTRSTVYAAFVAGMLPFGAWAAMTERPFYAVVGVLLGTSLAWLAWSLMDWYSKIEKQQNTLVEEHLETVSMGHRVLNSDLKAVRECLVGMAAMASESLITTRKGFADLERQLADLNGIQMASLDSRISELSVQLSEWSLKWTSSVRDCLRILGESQSAVSEMSVAVLSSTDKAAAHVSEQMKQMNMVAGQVSNTSSDLRRITEDWQRAQLASQQCYEGAMYGFMKSLFKDVSSTCEQITRSNSDIQQSVLLHQKQHDQLKDTTEGLQAACRSLQTAVDRQTAVLEDLIGAHDPLRERIVRLQEELMSVMGQ